MDGDTRRASPGATVSSYLGVLLAISAAVVMLWFLHTIATALLITFLAMVVAIALSSPVQWLRRAGLSRRWASVGALLGFFGSIVLAGWLVIPEVTAQAVVLFDSMPQLVRGVSDQLTRLLANYPELQMLVGEDAEALQGVLPSAGTFVERVGSLSLSLLGVLALTIVFLSAVIYVVIDPVPILRAYLGSFPPRSRSAAFRAYRRAARAIVGWTKASVIIGAIEFPLVLIFLSYMAVPGALVWAALAFFAEFIPRLGGYIMAIPPTIVALTLGPATAIWVALFYLAMNELLGNFVGPRIRGETMKIHPLMLIFFTLAFALAFGVLGAIVATPAAAFFSAFFSEFFIKRWRRDGRH